MSGQSALRLAKELKELQKNPVEGFSAGLKEDSNMYEWDILIVGPPETLYEGGMFRAIMTFPEDYPNSPPKLQFTTPIWHPNIYSDGKVKTERWLPIHSVESILISVISMLSVPNDESPANLDAAKQWREDKEGYKKKVKRLVNDSIENFY
ncbi:predicted protein [Naegleria gruberi]|uniref:Predicted protein n=1 Tax=Naegleria gruberi TaxID=5762 RepID=D2VIJ3_NAEGR|nr:uncharacterized protein NAEGRDRAFT_83191 [Naegleria gruberi]EFC43278.1 predicted protein [Naegleria gruberi]|eukprot:XP_002676022.1 predicted protein [Naegleria gruberi strain NEG-M]